MSGDNYFGSRRASLFGGSDGSLGPERKTLSPHQARALGFKTRRVFRSGGIAKQVRSGGLALTCLDSPPTDRPLIKEGEEKEHKQAAESLPSRLPLI